MLKALSEAKIVRSPIFEAFVVIRSPRAPPLVITGRQILSKISQMALVESERDYKWELNSGRFNRKYDLIAVRQTVS